MTVMGKKYPPHDRVVDQGITLLQDITATFGGRGSPPAMLEGRILAALASGRAPSQVALATDLGITPCRLSRALHVLEMRGWIERTRDPYDHRRAIVQLLAGGAHAAATPVRFTRETVRSTIAGLDGLQRYRLFNALKLVASELKHSSG